VTPRRLGLLLGLLVGSGAAASMAQKTTVTGEVISLSCYFQDTTNVGAKGAVCAQATVKWEGNPAGLLAKDRKVYQIAGGLAADNNRKVVPLLGRVVSISGETYLKDGMAFIAADDATPAK
jgi:hypothetical protein